MDSHKGFSRSYTARVQPKSWIACGALAMLLAVALGAFGAHGLKTRVDEEHLAIWSTAVHYHALHAIALFGFGVWRERSPGGGVAGWAFLTGIALFSGSLYGLALGGPAWLGPITPLGGIAFLLGWLLVAVSALRSSRG